MCICPATFGVRVTVFELQALKVHRKCGLSAVFSSTHELILCQPDRDWQRILVLLQASAYIVVVIGTTAAFLVDFVDILFHISCTWLHPGIAGFYNDV